MGHQGELNMFSNDHIKGNQVRWGGGGEGGGGEGRRASCYSPFLGGGGGQTLTGVHHHGSDPLENSMWIGSDVLVSSTLL